MVGLSITWTIIWYQEISILQDDKSYLAGVAPSSAEFHVAVGDARGSDDGGGGVAVRGQTRVGEVADVLLRPGGRDDL